MVSTILDLEGKDTEERLMGLHGTEKDGEMRTSLFYRCSDGKENFGNLKPGDLEFESSTASRGGLYIKMAPAGENPGHRGDEFAEERILVFPKATNSKTKVNRTDLQVKWVQKKRWPTVKVSCAKSDDVKVADEGVSDSVAVNAEVDAKSWVSPSDEMANWTTGSGPDHEEGLRFPKPLSGSSGSPVERNLTVPTVEGSMRGRPLQNGLSHSWDPKKGGISDDSDEFSHFSIVVWPQQAREPRSASPTTSM